MSRKQSRILDQYGNPVTHTRDGYVTMERTNYDAASGSALMYWNNATDVGPNEALDGELATIRKRARFERRNNGVAKGLGRKYANVAVGRAGPRLKINSPSEEWSRAVETAFRLWARRCGYRRGESLGALIHLGVREFFPCGEFFLVPRIDRRASGVKLRLLPIRPDRVASPNSENYTDGIETDVDGVPTHYWILKEDPDNRLSSAWLNSTRYDRIEAKKIIHVFVAEDPIQLRGEPWLSQALATFHKLRRADEGALTALEVAQKFAAFLTTTIPELAMDSQALLPSIMDLEDGTLTVPPPGYEPKQVSPEHPSHNLAEFRRDKMADAGSGVCMPVNAVTGDSSKHNFASARFDGLMFTTDADVIRGEIETQCCDHVFEWWFQEAVAAREIPAPTFAFYPQWLWPVNEAHTDPLKAANAHKTLIANGEKTVSDLVLESGRDDDDHFERLVREVERWRAAGLKHPLDAGEPVSETTEGDEDAQDLEEDDIGGAGSDAA